MSQSRGDRKKDGVDRKPKPTPCSSDFHYEVLFASAIALIAAPGPQEVQSVALN